jgi:hypothetical protein
MNIFITRFRNILIISSGGREAPEPLSMRESRSGERNIPSTLARDELNMVPATFPPVVWVKTLQLDIVVGRQARAYMPMTTFPPKYPRNGKDVKKKKRGMTAKTKS